MRHRALLATLLTTLFVGTLMAVAATATNLGFPVGQGWHNPVTDDRYEDWGFGSCGSEYVPGLAHLGADSQGTAPSGADVVPLADGEVVQVVDWGTYKDGNGVVRTWGQAVAVLHHSSGGSFVAVYGHVNSTVETGDPVHAGVPLATLHKLYTQKAPVKDNTHLHLGIRPLKPEDDPKTVPIKGTSNCTGGTAPLFGYVDPIPWLQARAPAQFTPACPSRVPDAGFADVTLTSPYAHDIDCMAWWGVAAGTSSTTYSPKDPVARWQMALFMVRARSAVYTRPFGIPEYGVPDGSDQGFTDIGNLPSEVQRAINRLKQLDITSGTSPTTFNPSGSVTRWEMALFLTRLLRVYSIPLPDGSSQGFVDIGGLSATTQTAINQLRHLGITSGVDKDHFGPYSQVTREQMATFIARTFNTAGSLDAFIDGSGSCTETECYANGTFPANTPFIVNHGWYVTDSPITADDLTGLDSHTFTVAVDGQPVSTSTTKTQTSGYASVDFLARFAQGLSGTHTFVYSWFANGQLAFVRTIVVSFDE